MSLPRPASAENPGSYEVFPPVDRRLDRRHRRRPRPRTGRSPTRHPVCAVGSQVWLLLRVHATTEPALSRSHVTPPATKRSPSPVDGPWRVARRRRRRRSPCGGPLFARHHRGRDPRSGLAVHATASLGDGKARALVATMPAPPAIAAAPLASPTPTRRAPPAASHRTDNEQRRRLAQYRRAMALKPKDPPRACGTTTGPAPPFSEK